MPVRTPNDPEKAPGSPAKPSGKPQATSEPPPDGLPYKTAPMPFQSRETEATDSKLFNLQFCTCGHDRMFHGNHVGKGKERRIILDCPKAGRCLICTRKGGPCTHFVFKNEGAGIESKKRRKEEKEKYKMYPPETTEG